MQFIHTLTTGIMLVVGIILGLVVITVIAIVYYAFEIALFLLAGGFLYWAIDRTF
tara:strand:+ start:746 stop:910 length:165 start_codon:yes stop_codon:yes gene_type:complete